MPRNYVWMPTEIPPKCKLSKWQKQSLQGEADQFVAEFYKQRRSAETPQRSRSQLK
jgi:hypothetical protein